MIGLAMMLAAARPLILTAEGPPCVMRVDGTAVADTDFAKTMKRLKARRRGVLIKIVGDVPYKCVGGAIYQVRRLRVKRVTFDPPLVR